MASKKSVFKVTDPSLFYQYAGDFLTATFMTPCFSNFLQSNLRSKNQSGFKPGGSHVYQGD